MRHVRDCFGIYDHEWRAYAPILGEPYLVHDYLLYFDGVALYLCAYHVGDTTRVLPERELFALLVSHPQFATARAVVIWGQFDPPSRLSLPDQVDGGPLERALFIDYDAATVDSVIHLTCSSSQLTRQVQVEHDKAVRAGLALATHRRRALGAEHLSLMTEWATNHSVSPFHAAFASSVASYVADSSIYLIEARLDGVLVGFAVTSLSSPQHMVLLQIFDRRQAGVRISDAIYAAVVRFVCEHGVEFLHLGYSATPGLLKFKRKWRANFDQPPYREAGYSADPTLAAAIAQHRITWIQRLLSSDFARVSDASTS